MNVAGVVNLRRADDVMKHTNLYVIVIARIGIHWDVLRRKGGKERKSTGQW